MHFFFRNSTYFVLHYMFKNVLPLQIKPCSELSFPVKIYFCVTILSLLSVIGLTIETLVRQTEEDFTISLIQLIGVVFCVYYVTRGILQENRQELIVFVLSILLVMFRSIVNFTVLSAEQKPKLLARFILILLVGSFDVICAIILIQSQSMMAFRVGGALESLQSQYFMMNLCFSMLTFDLQAQLCLCVLLISLHEITLLHNIISATGVLWACLKVTISIIAILKELKPLVWIFLTQNIPEVAFLIYLLYTVIHPTYLLNNGERGWRPLHYCMFYLFRINFSRQEPGQSAVELISQRERLSLEVSATGKVFRIIREITTKSSSTRYIAPQKCLLSFTRGLKWCQTI
ncbi:uncharacterized protein LOC115617487 isoform X1 [Strigops habroptila]|uniref:uncharacterized protein LOC115617487 isoform X1 n=1 Tax=Strigops habroptila TaxID=2489341 RepID=UPI0011CFD92E|nr:uncharacterized protein LOC115617487 isoform X1 [Strigops habroptila]